MKYQINKFNGILLEFENGNIAINGGDTVNALEKAYILNGKIPSAMIITCEHCHRSKNAVEFCSRHHIPLFCTKHCAEVLKLEAEKISWYDLRNDKTLQKYGLTASLLPVKYDSIDPFVLKINDGDMQYVFVFDGKITPENAEAIFSCDKIILQNIRSQTSCNPVSLNKRIASVYNTKEEIEALCKTIPVTNDKTIIIPATGSK